MTIHIIPLAAATVGKRECGECKEHGGWHQDTFDSRYGHGTYWHPCPACDGRGHTVTHDLTRGALACHYRPGIDGTVEECADRFERDLVYYLNDDSNCEGPYETQKAMEAALSAIRPGDTLAHDGSELGAKCAAVVMKIAMERWK